MSKSIYDSRQWRTYSFILIAILIVIATVYFSNSLSRKLAEEERNKAEVWAEAMNILTAPDTLDHSDNETPISYKDLEKKYGETEFTLMNLILKIIDGNNSIPTILCDENNVVSLHKNINIPEKDPETFLKNKIEEFKTTNPPIVIKIDDGLDQYLYYDDSVFLKRLLMFPYIQLSVVFAFIVLSFLALISAKKAEQNKVWVGLSKETAHQLGTPISSLIAWVEYLKTKDVDGAYLKEMEKDVKRLGIIADRFSKIGSNPDLLPLNINDSIKTSCEYMSTRVSPKVNMNVALPDEPALVLMNDSLFSWVIENLTKNAVDAMEGQGRINYRVEINTKKIHIDISDTGKGIPKSRFKTIFNPGYTTKTRGWGLGLSLVKRIIESYPGGKIYVKNSETGKGSTFRIELRKYHK
ncbi:MAG: HAMP domain-containing histidine kinase [Tannerella sp.]|jgi:archaellum component FlaG (FlaF/FlaG flagellin family)|nr:HAMP domain-containing histidine kinase [Tannerella sp.]